MTAPLTATDRDIIAALREDARMSVTELALRVGVSRTTAKARLDALIADGRIRRFTIETDADTTDEMRAISLIELQGSMSRSVIRALRRMPAVTDVYATNGSWDLVAELRFDSLAAFDRVLREIREVPGVRNSESCPLLAHVAG